MDAPPRNTSGRNNEALPVARLVDQDGTGLNGGTNNAPVVVGRPVPAPPTTTIVTGMTSSDLPSAPVATLRSSSNDAPVMSSTGIWDVPGCGSTDSCGGGSLNRSSSSSRGSGRGGSGDVAAGAYSTTILTHTGIQIVPGCGTSSGTGGQRFGKGLGAASGGAGRVGGSRSSSEKDRGSFRVAYGGLMAVEDGDYVEEGGPVLVACGYGRSMYDVQGCLSSWVLIGGGQQKPQTNTKLAAYGGEAADGGGKVVEEEDRVRVPALGPSMWALRSEVTQAGDGGVMCSACVPSVASGQRSLQRMLVTGGKDSKLREWEITDGHPRLVAELPGHTDWVSCCAIIPSSSAGSPPSAMVSGGRDGSVRFWSKSCSAAAAMAPVDDGREKFVNSKAFASRGDNYDSVEGGRWGGGLGGGNAGWSLASYVSGAHGSSEFVTCCACPGGASGVSGDWVATGATDWSVRLWDVVKSRELGRLSFKGHSHPVRCVAASSDGKLLVSGGEDHKVIVWSPQSRRAIATLQGHGSVVNGVAIDPGTHSGDAPRWVASGGGEGFLFVWDPRNWGSPVATLRGDSVHAATTSTTEEGSLQAGEGARYRGESGRWEGETTGATMLNSVNCVAAGGAEGGGNWLFGAGETVVRAWSRRDGLWVGGGELAGEGLGGVASLSVVE